VRSVPQASWDPVVTTLVLAAIQGGITYAIFEICRRNKRAEP
jgi:hypothetical protein